MSAASERLEELSALVAAGAATAEETAELAALTARDPAAAAEARAFADAAALLAEDLPPASPPRAGLAAIRARLDVELPATRAGGPVGEVLALEQRRKRMTAVAAVGLVAAASFAALWLLERDRHHRARQAAVLARAADATALREVRGLLEADLARAESQVAALRARLQPLAAPTVQLARMQGAAGGQVNVLADRSGRRWLVLAYELPPPGPTSDYELWLVPPGGKPVSAGLLTVGPDGLLGAAAEVPAELGAVVPALSREPKGGSPTGAPTEVLMAAEAPI